MGQDRILYSSLLHFNPPGYCTVNQVSVRVPACRCTRWSIHLSCVLLVYSSYCKSVRSSLSRHILFCHGHSFTAHILSVFQLSQFSFVPLLYHWSHCFIRPSLLLPPTLPCCGEFWVSYGRHSLIGPFGSQTDWWRALLPWLTDPLNPSISAEVSLLHNQIAGYKFACISKCVSGAFVIQESGMISWLACLDPLLVLELVWRVETYQDTEISHRV